MSHSTHSGSDSVTAPHTHGVLIESLRAAVCEAMFQCTAVFNCMVAAAGFEPNRPCNVGKQWVVLGLHSGCHNSRTRNSRQLLFCAQPTCVTCTSG